MKISLKNKHAIVCGSTNGIGKATAFLLAKNGCELTLVARNQNKLDETCSQLNTENNQTHKTVCADFNHPNKLKKVISSYLDRMDKPIDVLINNSGGPPGGPLIDASEDEFRNAFERLLICNHIMAKAVYPRMREQGSGRIINIISTSVNQVIPGLGVSNTVRGSVAQWGKTLALELGVYGICVNNILPGYTVTDRLEDLAKSKADDLGITTDEIKRNWADKTSLKRLGKPDEIANIILFLASKEASYVTGHNFSVDGGRSGA